MDALGILPAPVSARPTPGAPFVVTPGVHVVVGDEPDAVGVAVLVAGRVGELGQFPVALVHADDGAPGGIVLRLATRPGGGPAEVRAALTGLGTDPDLEPSLAREAYRLTVTTDRVEVVALTAAGLVRGVASLLQLVDLSAGPWPQVRCAEVVDHPRLAWRGLLVDVSESPVALPDAKALVNVMAMLKLNTLHIRVSDGVAWLPDVLDDGEVAGGFADLQAYAAARQIAVVPEIDVAGEAREDARTAEVLGRVAATTRAHVVHVGGRPGDDGATLPDHGERLGGAADDVAAAGAVVMAWQRAAPALSSTRHPGQVLQVRAVSDPRLPAAVADGAALVLSPVELDLGCGGTPPARREADPVAAAEAAGLGRSAVRGLEAVLGSRHGGTREGLFAALWPDLTAVAELAWSETPDPETFVTRVAAERGRWERDGFPVSAPAR
jgi:hexosaminidase